MLKRDSMNAIHKAATDTVDRIVSWINVLPPIDAATLSEDNTIFLIIDAINGFAARGGALYDPRVAQVMPNIAALLEKFPNAERFFFCDAHNEHSPEFGSYPPHALEGTWESQVVDELQDFTSVASIVKKNSTNAMLADIGGQSGFFLKYIHDEYMEHKDNGMPTFVIVGDVTDICVMQVALTLKAALNEWSVPARVILPADCVETFDLDATNHDADIMNLFALYNMNMNGIEVVANIK